MLRPALLLAAAMLCPALLATAAGAEPQPWMKRDDFETLSFYVDVDDENCPFTVDEIEAVVKGEALRARIVPVILGKSPESFNWQFHIGITATCLRVREKNWAGDPSGYAMSQHIHFGTFWADAVPMLYRSPSIYGIASADMDGKGYLIDSIRKAVADLLTHYLEANLAPLD